MDELFKEWVGEKYVDTLYEIISYCCVLGVPINRVFCFIGEGSNGKSSFIHTIEKFVGQENVSSSTLQNIVNSGFGTTCLYKKLVTTISEVEKASIKQTGILKSVSGGDAIRIEFKGKTDFREIVYTKLILAANKLPTTSDNSDGFMRRWTIIDFPNQFSEKRDIVESIPESEFSNLAKKVPNILNKLLRNGSFTNDGEIEDRRDKYISKSSNIKEFLDENYNQAIGGNSYVVFADLYRDYEIFCKMNDYKIESKTQVGRMLKTCGFGSEIKNIKDGFGNLKTTRVTIGLGKII
jgi:putative DNA primase/helicase